MTGVICTRQRSDEGRQVRKNSPDGDTRRFIVILGGRLSEAGTGRQLLARAKDEPWPICFRFVDKHRASNVRTFAIPFHPSRKKKDKIYFRLLHLVPSLPSLVPLDTRSYGDVDRFALARSNPWLARASVQTLFTFRSRFPRRDASRAKRGRFSATLVSRFDRAESGIGKMIHRRG